VRRRVLYFMTVLVLVLCVTVAITTPAMAGQISGSKNTIPHLPNMYRVGDTIYYETTVSNPVGNTANNTLTRIWDTLPDGTVIELLGANETLVQTPGDTDTFYTQYVVDWSDAVYNQVLGYWIVTDTFRAEGYDSNGDDLYVLVTKNSQIIQPHIDVEKYVWDGAAWQDADTPMGPHLLSTQNPVIFKFDIDNTGDVELTGVNLTDTDMSVFYTDRNCTSLAVFPIPILYDDDPIVTVYGKLAFTPGQHSNNATVTGTPPVGAPVSDSDPANYFGGNPAIDLIKYVSVNNQTSWDDANLAPGPSILLGKDVYFKFYIKNTGNVTLTGITLTDTMYNLAGIAPALPASLAAGAEYNGIIGPMAATAGGHTNTGNATGYWEGNPVSDTDPANYFGLTPGIDIEKYVSVDNGVTWLDADSAQGPSALVGKNVSFYVSVCNTGTANLTNILVSDTDFGFTGVVTSLAVGACDNSSIVTVAAVAGQQWDVANVTAQANGFSLFDEDPAYYTGLTSGIDIEKYVSVDDGVTWLDADSAPGPSALVGKNVSFYVSVCNTGTANLTSILVSDTDFVFTGVVASLAVGACDNSSIVTVPAVAGQQWDVANVTAQADGVSVFDEDPAYYRIGPPAVGWGSYPVNKLRVLLPWVALLAAIIAGASLLVLRRRRLG
jgi:uncharacterized repeat protein (TIGR01451 family)